MKVVRLQEILTLTEEKDSYEAWHSLRSAEAELGEVLLRFKWL